MMHVFGGSMGRHLPLGVRDHSILSVSPGGLMFLLMVFLVPGYLATKGGPGQYFVGIQC